MFSKPFAIPLFNLPLEPWPHPTVDAPPRRSVKADALTSVLLPQFELGLERGRSEQDKAKRVNAGRFFSKKHAAHP